MNPETRNFIDKLPNSEKADVMEYISLKYGEELNNELYTELDKRWAEYEKNPSSAISWEEFQAHIAKKHGF